jgi:hypothetical protein
MSTVEVKAATNKRASGTNPVVLYTVPAGKQAVVRTVNINNTSQAGANIIPVLGLRRSGSITQISTSTISNNASANMLTAPITMIAGDELVTTEPNAPAFGERLITTFPDGLADSNLAIVDGTTVICCNANGIYRSTNSGQTLTQVSGLSCETNIFAAKIGTDYFIYQSTTSARRSTDGGVTWTTQSVTNGPDVTNNFGRRISAPGRIVYNGTVYGALTSATQLSTTTNGITWTNVAAAFPSAVDCLVWSGTHWIAGRNASNAEIYRSTNGAAWTTVTARTVDGGGAVGGLATDGSGVVVTGQLSGSVTIGRSADHGATWSDQTTSFSGVAQAPTPVYIGTNFLFCTNRTNNPNAYSPSGLTGSFIGPVASAIVNASANSFVYGVNGTSVFYTAGSSSGLRTFTLATPTAYAGMDVTAAILEVTP